MAGMTLAALPKEKTTRLHRAYRRGALSARISGLAISTTRLHVAGRQLWETHAPPFNFEFSCPLHILGNGPVELKFLEKPIEALSDLDIAFQTVDRYLGNYHSFGCLRLMPNMHVGRVDVELTDAALLQFKQLPLPQGKFPWNPVQDQTQFEFLMRVVPPPLPQAVAEGGTSTEIRKNKLLDLLRADNPAASLVRILRFFYAPELGG